MQAFEVKDQAEKQLMEFLDAHGYSLPPGKTLEFDNSQFLMLRSKNSKGKLRANASYKAFLNEKRTKTGVVYQPGAYIKDFSSGQEHRWKMSLELTHEQKQALKQSSSKLRADMARQAKQREAEQIRKYDHHAKRCTQFFQLAPKATDNHPYLQNAKKVPLYSDARIDHRGNLVLPIMNIAGEIRSMQRINENGTFKSLKKGGEKTGNFIPLCASKFDPNGAFLIGEGYATVATGVAATGLNGIAAVDAGNLLAVAKSIRNALPNARLYFLVDNDMPKEHVGKGVISRGIYEAERAQQAVGGILLVPPFPGTRTDKESDWNDFSLRYGKNAIKKEIASQVLEQKGLILGSETHAAELLPGRKYILSVPGAKQSFQEWQFVGYQRSGGRALQVWTNGNKTYSTDKKVCVVAHEHSVDRGVYLSLGRAKSRSGHHQDIGRE